MAIQGGVRHLIEREGIIDNSGGLNKYLAVTPGTAQGHITAAGANEPRVLGLTTEDTNAQYVPQRYAQGPGIMKWTASAAIDRLTSTLPTQLICAANGKCAKLPTDAGTYYIHGEMDADSDAAAADGDVITARMYDQPQIVVISG